VHELVPCPSSTRTISVLMVSEATATCRSGFALRVQDGTAALPVGAFIRLVPNEGRECIFVEEEAVYLSFDRIDASFTDCWMMLSLGLCDRISGGLSIRPVSGVVGVGRQARWCADVKPDRQALYESNVLDEPRMRFYVRWFRNVAGAKAHERGGDSNDFTLNLSKVARRRLSELTCVHDRSNDVVMEACHEEPDCEFELGNSSIWAVLVRSEQERNKLGFPTRFWTLAITRDIITTLGC
jgi:hypothetical protein